MERKKKKRKEKKRTGLLKKEKLRMEEKKKRIEIKGKNRENVGLEDFGRCRQIKK